MDNGQAKLSFFEKLGLTLCSFPVYDVRLRSNYVLQKQFQLIPTDGVRDRKRENQNKTNILTNINLSISAYEKIVSNIAPQSRWCCVQFINSSHLFGTFFNVVTICHFCVMNENMLDRKFDCRMLNCGRCFPGFPGHK
mgnify:CR=1 FL=1